MPAWLWIGGLVVIGIFIVGFLFSMRSGGGKLRRTADDSVEDHRRKTSGLG